MIIGAFTDGLSLTDASVDALVIDTATAGSNPAAETASTTYDITTNAPTDGRKLTAIIDEDIPPGTTLAMTAIAPTGGVSAGPTFLALTGGAVDVVNNIDAIAQTGIAMQYRLTATAAAGIIASNTRTVTVTIANDS